MILTKQRGTAIIVALFLVSLVAVIALTMMARLNRDIRRTQLLLQSTQADLYAQGSLDWALDTLRNNWMNQKKETLIDRLPLKSPLNIQKNFEISSEIDDAQGLFNLNNLTTDEWLACFQRLLLIIDPTLSSQKAQNLSKSVSNWISPVSKNIEEDQGYTKLPVPYRNPHRPMTSVTEFRLIQGVTPELYRRILPYIIALPETTLINVNTAPPAILQSLSASFTAEAAKNLEAYRKRLPFLTLEKFLNMDLVRNHALSGNLVAVNSQYFLIHTRVENKEQQLLLNSLAHRIPQNNKTILQVLLQSKGEI